MLIINFSHPFTTQQKEKLTSLLENINVKTIKVHFNADELFEPQLVKLIESVGLSSEEWQTLPIIINPPSLSYISLGLVALLHAKMGHFPTIIRIRPNRDITPIQYEIAEVIDLQKLREKEREQRYP